MATKRKKVFLVRYRNLFFYVDGTYRSSTWAKEEYSLWRIGENSGEFEWKHQDDPEWVKMTADDPAEDLVEYEILNKKLQEVLATKAFEKEVLGHDKSRKKKG